MTQKPELLLPAGSVESLETAFLYGADAVYAGVPALSLRAGCGLTADALENAIARAHRAGKKIYLTLNLFSKNADVGRLDEFAKTVNRLRPDGLIVSDPGVFMFMREHAAQTPLHVSTQANVGSWLTAKFWRDMGAKVCVLSRETTFADICEIKRRLPDLKIEMFVHGAMCMSYSGRCLLSAFMAGRSANRGECAHACRWKYKLYLQEEQRPDEFMPVQEDDGGTYILNSRDLCLMPKLDSILRAGIDLLKIEGRNKTPYYVAQTARAYRKAIDDWFNDPESWRFEKYQAELDTLQNRGYTTGFFESTPDGSAQNYVSTRSDGDWRNAAVIRNWTPDGAEVEIFQKIERGDVLSFLPPDGNGTVDVVVRCVIDGLKNQEVETVSPGRPHQTVFIENAAFGNVGRARLPVLTVARAPAKR